MPSMKSMGSRQRTRNQNTSRSSKHTAWKKSRKFGDSQGIAAWTKKRRLYIPYLQLPSTVGHKGPILIENKPHRDYFFPVTGEEVMARLKQLPEEDIRGITHVWLRHMRPKQHERPFAAYCTGYRAIVINPWPRSSQWQLGRQVSVFWRKLTSAYNAKLTRKQGVWTATFSIEDTRRFYLNDLVFHEAGHHVDWRRNSPANVREKEAFAEQYALKWARLLPRTEESQNTEGGGQ